MAQAVIIKPQAGPQTKFLSTKADWAIYGGAAGGGKSFALLLECIRHINNPRFGAVLIRQSFRQIVSEGGLFDSSEEIYPYIGGTARRSAMEWLFPSGAKVSFAHLSHEDDKYKYQGSQLPLLCLQEDSPIVMGDGTVKKLRDIAIGDEVKTLEGSRKVVWKGNRRLENCVKANVYSKGQFVGSHIQSDTHKVLTPNGWLSYADIAYASRLSSTSSPTQFHCSCKCDAQSSWQCRTHEQFLDIHNYCRERVAESSQRSQGHQSESDSCVFESLKVQGIGCEEFESDSLKNSQPPLLNVHVTLHEPFPLSSFPSESLRFDFDDEPYVQQYSSLLDCQGGYSKDLNPCDERFLLFSRSAQEHFQQQVDAVRHSPIHYSLDESRQALEYSRTPQLYVHPYRKDVRQSSYPLQSGSCDFIGCGKHWVIDLTIADVSHYCTPNGLVNQNCFDELTHFSETQVFYMMSRNRSTCGIKPYIRCTTNPDANSWIAPFIDWWIDELGFPIPERSGVVRWFIRISGELIWADNPEDLRSRYPDNYPKSFTFIASNIFDNKILLDKDPSYLANLQSLHPVDQARLLGGNWKIKEESGKVFNRTWFEIVEEAPSGGTEVRFWDLAATEKTTACYTAGVKIRLVDGIYYIMDVIAEQVGPAKGDELIQTTAQQDGRYVKVRWELEGGSSGVRDAVHLKGLLRGFDAQGIPPLGDKVKRAKPLATDAYQGKVKLVRSPWNDRYLSILQDFPDSPIKDHVDASSGAYAALSDQAPPKARIGTYRT